VIADVFLHGVFVNARLKTQPPDSREGVGRRRREWAGDRWPTQNGSLQGRSLQKPLGSFMASDGVYGCGILFGCVAFKIVSYTVFLKGKNTVWNNGFPGEEPGFRLEYNIR
jgi:hypothetical protein